jgi:hypothetical protein
LVDILRIEEYAKNAQDHTLWKKIREIRVDMKKRETLLTECIAAQKCTEMLSVLVKAMSTLQIAAFAPGFVCIVVTSFPSVPCVSLKSAYFLSVPSPPVVCILVPLRTGFK